jgi:P-type Mg2+ transporter
VAAFAQWLAYRPQGACAVDRLKGALRHNNSSAIWQGVRSNRRHVHARRQSTEAERWWCRSRAEALSHVKSTEEGLSKSAAAARRRRDGPNVCRDEPRVSVLRDFARRFTNPLVVLLLAASAISGATGQFASFVIIIAMVLLSVVLDFFQEHRASRAAEQLRQSVMSRAMVLRDHTWQQIPAADLVRGDVVRIAAGMLVPADGCLLTVSHLHVNQAALTGESYPVEKKLVDSPAPSLAREQADHAVFMGTSVVAGEATVLICRTGDATAIGEVADAMSSKEPPTAFDLGTRQFGMLIMRLTFFMVLFVLFANAITHKPWLDSLLFAIALAVGLTPELLPMVVSVTLARGAMQMSRQQVIVKRLSAIEDLGAMDVLCTDKTGTLTLSKIELQQALALDGAASERVFELAYLNSVFETGVRTPMDEAIANHRRIETAAWQKCGELPFDFERRRVSVLLEHAGEKKLITKGAPEDIVKLCAQYETTGDGGTSALDATMHAAAQAQCARLGEQGLRVLAVAWKSMPASRVGADAADEAQLVLAGFLAFSDPPKPGAGDSMRELAAAGVQVKVVSGDNEQVTRSVCAAVGIPVNALITGNALAKLDDGQLDANVESIDVFCRVNPAQKKRIVEALQRRGRVVGFLGDGINDAPALRAADVGLSVDGAVDIAKEAADMILLKHDLGVLRHGVMEGRRTFANIRKYLMMGTSSNFGNMFSMAGASLFLPFLAMLPTQILLNNILYDLSEAAIPLDRVDAEEIAAPQHWDLRFIRNFMLSIGPVSSLFDFLTFYLLLRLFNADEDMFQTAWFVESLSTQVLVILVIRSRFPTLGLHASRPSGVLLAWSLLMVAIGVLLTATPLGKPFGFVVLPANAFVMIAALVICYLLLAEWAKRVFYRVFYPEIARHTT